MAGRIRAQDVEEVKARVNLADLVSDYVALKPAGVGSLKGLCPFHDERTPSFHVRPQAGFYHCFGCGESGDAITFLQNLDHLTFVEAVERLADRAGVQLHYEEGAPGSDDGVKRARLYAANKAAAEFFAAQLHADVGADAREFLVGRGFSREHCETFGIGFAPRGWSGLTDHLTKQGFRRDELLAAGLVSEGSRGVYDRFRGRVMWPIRDTSGQVLGFGARKLYEDDGGPKYLNTPETPIYQKSKVLYGLDLAHRSIAREKRVVVVEGYTDVMACHIAGETTAVATCGTAFGREHIAVLRRIMGDDAASEVIFNFDPDEAGQKAALRAFSEEKEFLAQTFAAVSPSGLDPADLRQQQGDGAIRELLGHKQPLFAFALSRAIAPYDLGTVDGRSGAVRAAAPIIQGIRDPLLRDMYTRQLALSVALDPDELAPLLRRVRQPRQQASGARQQGSGGAQQHQQAGQRAQAASSAGHMPGQPPRQQAQQTQQAAHTQQGTQDAQQAAAPQPAPQVRLFQLPRSPRGRHEQEALAAALQQPLLVGEEFLQSACLVEFSSGPLMGVRDGIAAVLPRLAELGGGANWLQAVGAAVAPELRPLVYDLGAVPLPETREAHLPTYARRVVSSLIALDLDDLQAELRRRLRQTGESDPAAARRISEQLQELERQKRAIKEE